MRFQIGAGPPARAALSLTQGFEFREFVVELAVDEGLRQQVPLDFAAGGLGNTLGRNDLRDLEPRMLIDERADRGCSGQELAHGTAVQYEYAQFLALSIDVGDVRGHHFVEVQSGGMLRDVLEVVGIIILAVDEDDFLAPARNVERTFVEYPKITRVHPAIRANGLGGGLQVAEITVCDARAAYQDVSDDTLGQRRALFLYDEQLRIGDARPDAHEFDDIPRSRRIQFDASTNAQFIPIRANPAIVGAGRGQAYRKRGFCEPVGGVHGVAR